MTKKQFLSLWNVDSWKVMNCGVYFMAKRTGSDFLL